MNKKKKYNTMFLTIKKLVLIFTLSIFSNQLIAQTTNGIFFQAVARDNFSNPAKDRKIFVQSSIIQSTPTGTKVLTEEHQANTDATGVFSISLGNGVRVGGTASSLTTIDWSKGPYYLNLKVAITPVGGNSNWDYNKEWVDMGTTSFGAVPFALYSASSAKVDDKLNVSDTSTMLKVYAKAIKIQSLETSLASKLTAADTLTMLAPYAKAAYTIDSSFFKTQLATKLSIADSTIYVTPTQLAAKTFDQTPITTAIATKLNIADSTKYVTPTQLAAKTFDQTPITTAIATKLNIADSTKYITPTQLAAKTFDTTSLSSRINLKASTTDVTTAISNEATTARAAELVLTNNITSNTASITANAVAIANESTTARAAELLLTNNITSNTASITANSVAIVSEAATARAAELVLTNNVTSNTSSITANSAAIVSEAATARAAELTLTNNIASSATSITAINTILSAATSSNTANTIVTRDASGNFSAGSITASNYASTPISLSYTGSTINWNPTVGANAAITLTQNSTLSFSATPLVGSYGTVVLTQDGTGGRTITLPTISNVTNKVLGSATNTTVSLSTAADAKDILNFYYDGTNCYWNIGQGYGNAPTASFTLTTAGTGAATLSGTTLNIPSVSSTVNSGSISGTIAVANGGTGATTLTGYVKGTGTTAMTASANIPVADVTGAAPLASPTFTGTVTTSTINTGALSATSVNTPIYASTPQTLTDDATISWNPTLGLNASVTLAGNRTLSFTSTPAAGSYGTLVVTQDATGGRTLTLPSTANKVLGSSSTTTITLSTTANAKDILNFYYDGTNCYWNIGQGYGNAPTASFTLTTTGTGAASLSGTTLNIPSVSSTVNAGSISGTIAVANGGTGATAITGLVKGNGSGAMTAAVPGTDYLLPTDASTTAKGIIQLAGDLSGTATSPTVNTIGGVNSSTIATFDTRITSATNSITSNTSSITSLNTIVNAATNSNTVSTIVKRDASGNFSAGTITANLTGNATTATTAGNVTGTVAVGNGGTGATTLTANNVLLGNGTSAVQAVAPGTTGNVLTSNGTTWTSAAPSGGGSTTYSIGDSYGGGIVFYVTSDGKHGLISETQLISPNANSSSNSDIYYYSEAQNMISDPNNHSTNGKLYTDWRLPTKSEFARLHAQRALFNSNYPNYQVRLNYYVWTSTPGLPPNETSTMTTFYQGIPAESAFNAGKSGVIAIRSF
jgi:hypothetical protein